MKRGLIIFLLLILIPSISAVSTTLSTPTNDASTSTTVNFTCSASDGSFDLASIALYTNTSGAWTQYGSATTVTGSSNSTTFTLTSLSAKMYQWNCEATNTNLDSAFAAANYTFTVTETSTAPAFSGPINNITWEEDNNLSNNITLSNFFTDTETLSYTVSGNSNINVSISTATVSFYPTADWSGTETIRFTASDGALTNTSNYITLNVTPVADAPRLKAPLVNISWAQDTTQTLTLTTYFEDPDSTSLNYTATNSSHINVTISSTTATLTPTTGWSGTESITFNVSDGNLSFTATASVTVNATSSNTAPTIDTHSPTSDPALGVGDTQDFLITYSDTDNDTLTVKWYVGSTEQSVTGSEFTYTADALGTFTIKAQVSDGTTTTEKTWTVTVGTSSITEVNEDVDVDSIIGDQTTSARCGNGIAEEGETCSTCLLDVPCESGFVCETGTCVEQKSATTTIILFVLIVAIILIVIVGIYYFTTTRKVGKTSNNEPFKYNPTQQAPPADYTDFYKKK
tara:strand:- start:29 stop:1573 length:1545 start_codon:yes stop_codon:yes gene_type:complete